MSKERRDNIIAAKQGGGSTGITTGVSWDANAEIDGWPTEITIHGNYGFPNDFRTIPNMRVADGVTEIRECAYNSVANYEPANLIIPNSVLSIGDNAFEGAYYMTINTNNALPELLEHIGKLCFSYFSVIVNRIWIPVSVTEIISAAPSDSAFYGCVDMTIYCEAESKPAGWGTYWNYYDAENQLTVVWGTSKAEFDALE